MLNFQPVLTNPLKLPKESRLRKNLRIKKISKNSITLKFLEVYDH